MPVWGDVLTPEQLDALVTYTFAASKGAGAGAGAQLFAENCAACHGQFGEGGPNPTRPGDIIAPISSAEFLKTRDDITLRNIISQGQPNFGMSPFGAAYGGPLSDDEVDALVAFVRGWQANPPVELPPEVSPGQAALTGAQIYTDVCSRCHGPNGEGGLGPALADANFQAQYDNQALFDEISQGHEATPMIAWGEILTPDQLEQLVRFIRSFKLITVETTGTPSAPPSFSQQIAPLLKDRCSYCHNEKTILGGWDASTYDTVMTTGTHSPVVVPGDARGSLLAQKVFGTQLEGDVMPPGGLMPEDEILLILDWIAGGAPNN
jgi:mono/diheme cytochrome c family protein